MTEAKASYHRILRSTSIIGGASFINIAIGVLRTKVLAVLLGPAGVGLASLYTCLLYTSVVWVGDTEVDVAAARELGVRVCTLTCGLRTEEYLVSVSPDCIEPDLHSFAEKMNRNND